MTTRTFPDEQQRQTGRPSRRKVRETLNTLRAELLAERTRDGHWIGQLSPSALSTATAISAMSAVLIHNHQRVPEGDQPLEACIRRGIEYLRGQQNEDGGYGDTDRSHSNIATSYLVLAASGLAQQAVGCSLEPGQRNRLNVYISATGAAAALRQRYGTDKTFVVPILTNLAIAGVVPWDEVPALPFEAAVFPQSMYRLLQMPVVSYAIPALVAIGQARHFHGRKAVWPLRAIRAFSIGRSMKVLRKMQPDSGGYLEATPLTSFVVMSLAATGRGNHEVSRSGLRFLVDSMNDDGSWPIDTNLATWVTSLAVHALACDPDDDGQWCSDSLVDWHLSCQHTKRHPFTGAPPGGWGWSDLSGAVPDADDTPAGILAITQFQRWVGHERSERCRHAADHAAKWLRGLQNSDGGWPTFCRGWGKLPFDRSSVDLTAHGLRALASMPGDWRENDGRRFVRATTFLCQQQRSDGSWHPLWFGNQDREDESNPVYGTSRVLLAAPLGMLGGRPIDRATEYLIGAQNVDGGWGGGASVAVWLEKEEGVQSDTTSSIEETALAIDALVTLHLWRRQQAWDQDQIQGPAKNAGNRNPGTTGGVESHGDGLESPADPCGIPSAGNDPGAEAIIRGIDFLIESVEQGRHRVPWPIGFYFAKLWYHERLYPLIFAITALGKCLRASAEEFDPVWPR